MDVIHQKIIQPIDRIKTELWDMADNIFDHPEIGLHEFYASRLLCGFLEKHGFSVERGIAGLDTAFRAVWQSGEGGPSIGLLCEYDALEGLGHACGHHAQGPAILGAAIALKESLQDKSFRLVIYGTPAEETTGGKLTMLREGCFTDIDVALMMHLSPTTCVDTHSLAMRKYTVTFTGRSSHAALHPEQGRSALDGLLMMFHGIEYLREHVMDDVRMHYTVLDAGGPANIVPGKASGRFYLRSRHQKDLSDIEKRFLNIAKGAALITDTQSAVELEKMLDEKVPVECLNQLLMKYAEQIGAEEISPPREKTGSSDFNNVQQIVPGACIRIHFVPRGTASHSQQFLEAGKSCEAHHAILLAAEILSCTAYDLICDPMLLESIKENHKSKLKTQMQSNAI